MFAGAAYEELASLSSVRGTACIRCRGVQAESPGRRRTENLSKLVETSRYRKHRFRPRLLSPRQPLSRVTSRKLEDLVRSRFYCRSQTAPWKPTSTPIRSPSLSRRHARFLSIRFYGVRKSGWTISNRKLPAIPKATRVWYATLRLGFRLRASWRYRHTLARKSWDNCCDFDLINNNINSNSNNW